MLKFRCQHCGQRIAVPARHLGRLVTCAECGAATHPLAEQISAAGAPSPARAPSATTPFDCDNCGSPIGRLQSSHPWNGHRVCGACFARLSGESAAPALLSRPAPDAPLARPAPAVVTRSAPEPAAAYAPSAPLPKPLTMELRERVLRALIVFVVASVALYGALSLLRDIAGLIAVAAVALIALLALYALFRGALAARHRRPALAPTRPRLDAPPSST